VAWRILINTKVQPTLNHFSTELLSVPIVALQDLDLEGDWDPGAHDRQMAGIYAQDDGEFHDEDKPTWDDDIDIDDIIPPTASSSKEKKRNKKDKKRNKKDKKRNKKDKKRNKKDKKKGKKADVEDEDYEMGEGDEAGREDEEWDEEWDGTEEMRKKKLQEYMDSLLELEFNDVVSVNNSQYHSSVFLILCLGRSLGSLRDSNTPPPRLRRSV